MSEKYSISTILKLMNSWFDFYKDNNIRGYQSIKFIVGEQWGADVYSKRTTAGKETLVLNMALKHLYRLESEYANISYELKVRANSEQDIKQIKAAEKVLKTFMLAKNNKDVLAESFIKYARFGYNVLYLKPSYADDYSEQMLPKLEALKRPDWAFFDKRANDPSKEDGSFCGYKRFINAKELKTIYPKISKEIVYDDDRRIEVIDFWYKDISQKKFYKLQTGTSKLEEDLTDADKTLLTGEFYVRPITEVYSMRITNHIILQKPTKYYINEFPLVFVGDSFAMYEDNSEEMGQEVTLPYTTSMQDIQKMLNIAASQVATQTKNLTSRTAIATTTQIEGLPEWEEYGIKEGVFRVNPQDAMTPNTPPFPQIVPGTQLDGNLMQLMQYSKLLLDEVAGVNLSQQGSADDKTASGVAVMQRIQQGDILQKRMFKIFLKAVNRVGRLVKKLLPILIKNEYNLVYENEIIVLNKKGKEEINLNLDYLNREFEFSIEAAPSTTLEKMRSAETMLQVMRLMPQYQNVMADLMVKNLVVNDAVELERRFEGITDPLMQSLGSGSLSLEEYRQQKQQQQQQQQQQELVSDPLLLDIKTREAKGKMDAQIKIQQMQADGLISKEKLALEKAKIQGDNEIKNKELMLKTITMQEKEIDKYIAHLDTILRPKR